jgi:hypothetical protein
VPKAPEAQAAVEHLTRCRRVTDARFSHFLVCFFFSSQLVWLGYDQEVAGASPAGRASFPEKIDDLRDAHQRRLRPTDK